MRHRWMAGALLALACVFAAFACGCNQLNEEEQLVRAERASETWDAWLAGAELPGAMDLTEAFGVYRVEDEWGISLPRIDLDGEKTKLIVDLLDAYNATVPAKEQLTITQGLDAFGHLSDTLGVPDPEGDLAYRFVFWVVSPAADGSGRSNLAAVAGN